MNDARIPVSNNDEQVLQERAQRLSVPLDSTSQIPTLDVVRSDLPGIKYAIESRYTREIIRTPYIASLPHAPDFALGLINLRGEVVLVVSLESLIFGSRADFEFDHVVAIGRDSIEFAIAASREATDVHEMQVNEILSADGVLENCPYVRGVTSDSRVIIDGAALLDDTSLYIQVEHAS